MTFHLYDVTELYSNADGTIQFIELAVGGNNGEDEWQGQTITVTQGGTVHSITFDATTVTDGGDGHLPSNTTQNTTVLLATSGFAAATGITPNFIIPDNFLFTDGGVVNYASVDSVTYNSLPTDGALSISTAGVRSGGAITIDSSQSIQLNSPKNFAGDNTDPVPSASLVAGATAGADSLVGGAGDDVVAGLAGNDTLDGGAGNDTLMGGLGDDRFLVDSAGDYVFEKSGEGNADTVLSSITYTLGTQLENLTLTGSDPINGTGNAGTNVINGNTGANTLAGLDGNDTLFGSSGADSLDGGNGNDSIWGGDDNDQIQGGAGDDTVQGNAGDDFVRGALGNDEVRGGQGNDTVQGGAGLDVVRGALGNDEMRGGLDNDQLFGGQGNDTLFGGQGNDTLQGLLNDDVLQGLLGNDLLTGGGGLDQFWFHSAGPANADTITDFDFNGEADTIVLQAVFFTQLAGSVGNPLGATNFAANAGAVPGDADDYILYDTATGSLWYDDDGNGGNAAQQFAVLVGAPTLAATDFLIVA